MNYDFKVINKETFDSFNKKQDISTLLQSYNWGNVKCGWKCFHYGIFKEEFLVGTFLILKKILPLNFSILYIPKGPILDFSNYSLLQFFSLQLKKISKREKALLVKLDLPILYRIFKYGDYNIPSGNKEIIYNMKKLGFIHCGFNLNMNSTIQPRFQMVISKKEFCLKNLTKKGRQGINMAIRRGVIVETYRMDGLNEFSRLMSITSKRKNLFLREKDYYKRILDAYPDAFITLGKINIKERMRFIEIEIKKKEVELEQRISYEQKKKKQLIYFFQHLRKEQNFLKEFIKLGNNNIYISGTLMVPYGKKSDLLYAGMDQKFKYYMPSYLTWFKSMEKVFEKGCEECNLGGIDGSFNDGLTRFKQKFNPRIHEFIGEFDFKSSNTFIFNIIKRIYSFKKRHL